MAGIDEGRRRSFDAKAAQYDAARPGYPDALFEHVLRRTGAHRVLEIGAGTGQATVPLARFGCEIVALEPGPRLAAILRRRTAHFPTVRVVEATFEAWTEESTAHDLVLAAQSLHWVDASLRYVAAARVAPHLAVLVNETGPIDPRVRADFDVAYDRWTGGGDGNERARNAVETARREWTQEIESSGLYAAVHVAEVPWSEVHTADSYVRLVDTYSENALMPAVSRAGLYADLAAAIDRHGGRLVLPRVSLAFVAAVKS